MGIRRDVGGYADPMMRLMTNFVGCKRGLSSPQEAIARPIARVYRVRCRSTFGERVIVFVMKSQVGPEAA